MLKRKVKISLCLLLHVSVQLDHPQGAYAEPCKTYNIVELITKNTSLYDCGNKYFRLWCVCYVYCVLCSVRLSHILHSTQYTSQPEILVCDSVAHYTAHSTHTLKYLLPQHRKSYNDVFLLIISTIM
jgi:hypothetical protein